MNTNLIIILLIVGLGVFAFVNQQQEIDKIETLYRCEGDIDCILVTDGCCSCGVNGRQTTINKKFEEEWNNNLKIECEDTGCFAAQSRHPSCFKESKCVENKCILMTKTDEIKKMHK